MRTLLLTALLLLASIVTPATAQTALPGLTEGVQYRLIENGQPYQPLPPGMVEVAEVFAYTCPHCAHFAPMLDAWSKQLPSHARLALVPGVFNRDDPWSRAFFAAQASQSLNLLHPLLFAAIHDTGALPHNASAAQIMAFVSKTKGVNVPAFKATFSNEAVLLPKLRHAYEFAASHQVEGTPTVVVAGRYLILGNSYDNLLANARAVVDALAPRRRAAPAKPAAAGKPVPHHP